MYDKNWFNQRFSRHFPLKSIGTENQKLLQEKSALIAGLGGLGTVSADLLVSFGIGSLRLVDYDVIELSNIPRQKLYYEEDIGKSKVDVAEARLKLRNPKIRIDPQATRIDALSAPTLIDQVDIVVDGLDRFSSRKPLHRAAYVQKKPYVFAGAISESANVMTFTFEKDEPCLECVIGNTRDDPNLTCEIAGVHPSILHFAAGIQATEALRILTNQEPVLKGTMMFIDLETMEFEKVKFKKNPDCQVCGNNEIGDLDQGKLGEITKAHRNISWFGRGLVTSICGRDTLIIDPSWEISWDFEMVKSILRRKFNVRSDGNNFSTFGIEDASFSLLKSGVATIRGSGSSKNAIKLYAQMYETVTDELKLA